MIRITKKLISKDGEGIALVLRRTDDGWLTNGHWAVREDHVANHAKLPVRVEQQSGVVITGSVAGIKSPGIWPKSLKEDAENELTIIEGLRFTGPRDSESAYMRSEAGPVCVRSLYLPFARLGNAWFTGTLSVVAITSDAGTPIAALMPMRAPKECVAAAHAFAALAEAVAS